MIISAQIIDQISNFIHRIIKSTKFHYVNMAEFLPEKYSFDSPGMNDNKTTSLFANFPKLRTGQYTVVVCNKWLIL